LAKDPGENGMVYAPALTIFSIYPDVYGK